MKRIGYVVTLATLAMLPAASVNAQTQRYDPAIPRGLQQQSVEPSGELAKPEPAPVPPRLIQNRTRAQRDADARHCLDRASNKSVHRCSLPYRSRATKRAGAVKTKAKAPAAEKAPKIETSKPADIGKPGAPRPGDAAKAAELVKPMDVTKSGAPISAAPGAAKAPAAAKPPSGVPAPATTPGAPAKTSK